jgi:hypothetical protein
VISDVHNLQTETLRQQYELVRTNFIVIEIINWLGGGRNKKSLGLFPNDITMHLKAILV